MDVEHAGGNGSSDGCCGRVRAETAMPGAGSDRWPPRAGDPRDATWTEIGDDLKDCQCPPDVADAVLRTRLAFASGDMSRVPYWHMPEGVDAITDIPYVDDGIRGHLLDMYLPHDAVVRGGHSLPVFVDIHGGGFVYGYKELNRNFCVHLANRGFAVVSLNYRPAPQTDFLGQLHDLGAAFIWMREHLADYPVDSGRMFLTGDSAGGTLAFYTASMLGSGGMARSFGVEELGLTLTGLVLVSGLYDLAPYAGGWSSAESSGQRSVVDILGPSFFGTMGSVDERYRFYDGIVRNVDLPPSFLLTSSDDFLESDTLELGAHLARAGKDFELHDIKPAPGTTVGHVFPVCMSWIPESVSILDRIRDSAYELM
ncbi:alpha/beta hydrolase [uncultured Bifidobacterium sp.]|uniref:alpha/beta hydrolase n=1 Tax=uncultured Bifidobacterium sp. TaxID=165187 RepID=UPI00262DC155|nr:alpha/beta hydrolase [uncultured Bifidobacterium sp.]